LSDGWCAEAKPIKAAKKWQTTHASSGLLPHRTGQKLAECTALGGLWEECKDKVNETDKNYPVGTVSGGGWMER
jgi:hypothetical protein